MRGFLLDTNVVSELIKLRPEPKVVAWVESTDNYLFYASVLTLGELRKGIATHPDAVRRLKIESWLEATLKPWFEGRFLPVDMPVAERWGLLAGKAQANGSPLPIIDALLAATAIHYDLVLVTRNVQDLARTGAEIFNPWSACP